MGRSRVLMKAPVDACLIHLLKKPLLALKAHQMVLCTILDSNDGSRVMAVLSRE
jgi:hypothetical protein